MHPIAPTLQQLLNDVRSCQLCRDLPLGPKPILQFHPAARILIAAQAPGRLAHVRGRTFDDPSGDRLRRWMGIGRTEFYDETKIAIMAMGFCFPGTSKGGDLPPRAECAPHWRQRLLAQLPNIALTLVIGRYSQAWHLPGKGVSVTECVKQWQAYSPAMLPLPHPSPRNSLWLKNNPWFEAETLPQLQVLVRESLNLSESIVS